MKMKNMYKTVIFTSNSGYGLTHGKEYRVCVFGDDYYSLITDDGEKAIALKYSFKEIPLRHQDCRCSMPTSKDKAKNMLNTKTTYITTDCAKFDDLDIAIAYQEMINKDNDKVFGITKEEFMGNSDVFAKKILEAFDLIKNKGDK
jgi:hypothetical protein